MAQIYENGEEFNVVSNQDNCVVLNAPPRGTITKFVIKQVTGAEEGYVFNVYNRKDACPSEAEISTSTEFGDQAPGPLLDSELHQIMPEVTVSTVALDEQHGVRFDYANEDAQDVRKRRNSRIYLGINPVGTGAKDFQVMYTIEPAPQI